jgi:hypothetical protein
MINEIRLDCKKKLKIKNYNIINMKNYNFRFRNIQVGSDYINL